MFVAMLNMVHKIHSLEAKAGADTAIGNNGDAGVSDAGGDAEARDGNSGTQEPCMYVCMPTLHRTKKVYMHSCIIDTAAVSSTEASDGGAHQTLSAASKPHVELRLEERDGSTFCDVVMSL